MEFPRNRTLNLAAACVGGLFIFVAVIVPAKAPLAAQVFFIAMGAPLVVLGLSRALSRSPRFRADERGVWFGGGAIVPWSDVKQVFEVDLTVKGRRAAAIAFEFQRRATLFKTPIENWISAPFAVGDVDVSPGGEGISVAASKLEAMRVKAGSLAA